MLFPNRRTTQKAAAVVACIVMAGCGPQPAFTPFESYTAGQSAIYGYVTDLYSCGLEGATVQVTGSADSAVTNGSGQYRLRVASGKSYSLTAANPGFDVNSTRLDVGSEPLRWDFSLVPAPDCPDGNCRAYKPPCRPEQFRG